jgi:hypothetical protein
VAFRAASGESFVGHPSDFDWTCLEGTHLVAHNATFDGMVLTRQMEQGVVPRFNYTLDCTADMCAFMNAGRSLKDAAKNLLGMTLSKKVRSDMDGKTYADLNPDEVKDLLEYGGSDADVCFELWDRFSPQWPEWEREISRENRAACWRGVHIDVEATKAGLEILKAKNEAAIALIPWVKPVAEPEPPFNGKKKKAVKPLAPGSTPQLKKHAIALGIPIPPSFDKTTPEMQAWVKQYAAEHPFIQARLDYASTNPHIARLEAMIEIADADGIVRFDSRYYGSHTGRCSGSGGEDKKGASGGARMNFFNMPKGEKKDGIVHGVDIRGLITPRPGHKFIIRDYSNIEPRVTHWIAGNTEFLSLVAQENIYQVNAKMMGWFPRDGKGMKHSNAKLYQLSKACVIGLSYSMGAAKFVESCDKLGVSLDPVPPERWFLDRTKKFVLLNVAGIDYRDPQNADAVSKFLAANEVVKQWRDANPRIASKDEKIGLWAKLQAELEVAATNREKVHYFRLPSGRKKGFFNPHFRIEPKTNVDPETGKKTQIFRKNIFAQTIMGGDSESLHGGVITENLVQAIARDIMFWGAMDCVKHDPDFHYIGNVYDEVIIEVPDHKAEYADKKVSEFLTKGSALSWAKGLPLAVEGPNGDEYGISERYEK